ncbi:MAG: DNA helicase, partial [Acidobacteria bacterium]|nr:DNA helicase [Acidobacteriota bacterium]
PAPNTAGLPARLRGGRFKRELRPFQERDLAQLLALPHGANFSVPGAGKTSVAYAIYEAERLAERVSQLLVIAPLSAFPSWMEEIEVCFEEIPLIARFDGGRIASRVEILLVNYHRLAASYEDIAKWAARAPTHLVLDEAHRMKRGWEGQWGSACLNLAFLAQRRDILTGTPAPQSPGDLQALLNFLWPNQARRIIPPDALAPSLPPDADQRIVEAIRPLFVRTTKHELQLRPPDYSALWVPLAGLHEKIYQAMLDLYAGQFPLGRHDRVTFAQMGKVVMYLLEAATNPCLLVAGSSRYDPIVFRHPPLEIPPDSPLRELLIHYPRYETPAKFVHLARIIEANASQNRKTLVWTNFGFGKPLASALA